MRDFVITSESVTAGHPDKLCDQISDAIVDAYLSHGVRSGIAAECALATGVIFLSIRGGEDAPIDAASLARRVISDAGYEAGDRRSVPTVMIDYAREPAVVHGWNMVSAFGYAAPQSPTDMPFPIWAVHRITQRLDALRREEDVDWLAPDGQAQIAVEFKDRAPSSIAAVALQVGLLRDLDRDALKSELTERVIEPALAPGPLQFGDGGRLVLLATPGPSGPPAHSGLTGRKSADDAYGTFIRRSGPALSGKDPSRIDRIAAYAARHAARNAVAAGLAKEIEVQLSYIAGDREPVSVEVDSYGSGAMSDRKISERIREVFDFDIGAIAERMGLWTLPEARGGRFFRDLATYGHMGRDDLDAPWEDTAEADRLA